MLGEALGSDYGTVLGFSNFVYDESKDGILDALELGLPLGYNDGLIISSD